MKISIISSSIVSSNKEGSFTASGFEGGG